MSYGVALRNGVPFTLGTIAALCVNATGSAWSPLALWPNGAASPGMWISPSLLTASFNDSTGTTPVATPGSVADSANPVGLALDIRAGATVLTDPGNHMLQATSTARPLLSARVNLLLMKSPYPFDASDDMTGAAVVDATVVNAAGTNTITCGAAADVLVRLAKTNPISAGVTQIFPAGVPFTYSFDVVGVGGAVGKKVCFVAGRVGGPNASEEITLSAVTQRVSAVMPAGASPSDIYAFIALKGFGTTANLATGDEIEVTGIQLNIGSDADAYQYADTTALYPSTGITPFQLYDGTDDGMATASFAAGTLINGMDCMIALRRDSAAARSIAGLYQADQTKYFGVVGDASGDVASTYGGCGTPSIFVDGASVTNTRGALFDALGVGEFHILEYRDLDLSTWVDAAWGGYPTYLHNGARGDIMLFPSTASTADKDAARKYLADKYGVTLP